MRISPRSALHLVVAWWAPARGFTPPLGHAAAVVPNDNRIAAGHPRRDTLFLALDVDHAVWKPRGPADPGIDVEAFAESGKPPTIPGPLIRVRSGTIVRVTHRAADRAGRLVRGTHHAAPRGNVHLPRAQRRARADVGRVVRRVSRRVVHDTATLPWHTVAKDGADLPARQRRAAVAELPFGEGETMDLELPPDLPSGTALELRFPGSPNRGVFRLPIVTREVAPKPKEHVSP